MSDFAELFGEEIVLLVFSFLPVADLQRASRVNHTWMRIALDQQLWKIRCKKGGRKSVMEYMVTYYKSKKLSVPWRDLYSVLYRRHQFSAEDKSEDIILTQDDTVATAQNYLNVTVKSKDRMQPSPRQPFHYYQILVVEKKYTHMSVGITDSDWAYTGNLVGFGQNCYNYAFHSNGLILHNSNSEVAKVPMYGTGDSVGLLVQYEDKTKQRPTKTTATTASTNSGVGVFGLINHLTHLSSSASSSYASPSASSREGDGDEGCCMAGVEMEKYEEAEAEEEGREAEEKTVGNDDRIEDGGEEEEEDGNGHRGPIEELLKRLAAAKQQQEEEATMLPNQPMTKRRKGHKLVLYLFLNGQWCYTWKDIRPPPYGEVAFTVALNGTGASVALNQEEDVAQREKRKKAL